MKFLALLLLDPLLAHGAGQDLSGSAARLAPVAPHTRADSRSRNRHLERVIQ